VEELPCRKRRDAVALFIDYNCSALSPKLIKNDSFFQTTMETCQVFFEEDDEKKEDVLMYHSAFSER
jgi:hypothetical protein